MQQQYFIEQAPTYYEAERKAREKYGERLTILMHETVKIPGGFLNLFSREGVKITGIIPAFSKGAVTQKEIFAPGKQPLLYQTTPPSNASAQKGQPDLASEKEKLLALAGKEGGNAPGNNALKEVLAEMKSIREKLENSGLASSREEHPILNRLDDVLILNDFPASYRKAILDRARKEFSLSELNNYKAVQDKALEWIGESVKIFENDKFSVRPRIMILVGPTGVGKTTTIAKLAANFGIDFAKGCSKRNVVLITIDAYRIGAKEQLQIYSGHMEVPFFSVTNFEELKRIIAANSEAVDLILIDTIGRNPRDMVQLGEMKHILDACGTLAEVHLAVAATTKSSDLREILQQFEAFNYRSVVVTKMDETIRTGNIIGVLSEKSKPVSYITDGQGVPTDIKKASVIHFLKNLEGFTVNRVKLEERFPSCGRDMMQKWS